METFGISQWNLMEASGIRGKLVEFKGTPVESHGHQGKKVEASGNKCKPVESD
jgi:hypothetical protein